MSLINAVSMMHYTMLANNSACAMMNASNARMGLLGAAGGNMSMGALCAMDTQLELDMITNGLQYQMSKAMLEQLKKQQAEDSKRFNIFA